MDVMTQSTDNVQPSKRDIIRSRLSTCDTAVGVTSGYPCLSAMHPGGTDL